LCDERPPGVEGLSSPAGAGVEAREDTGEEGAGKRSRAASAVMSGADVAACLAVGFFDRTLLGGS
jgi:hypothetical protein